MPSSDNIKEYSMSGLKKVMGFDKKKGSTEVNPFISVNVIQRISA